MACTDAAVRANGNNGYAPQGGRGIQHKLGDSLLVQGPKAALSFELREIEMKQGKIAEAFLTIRLGKIYDAVDSL